MTTSASATLRALIDGEPFIAADCYSALSARIVEHVGFAAAYMGGHATGMMHYAIPDNGALTPTEMIEQAARVVEAVTIPIIADADQAGDSIADVHRTIQRFEAAGVAGVHIEDEQTPKHSTFKAPLLSIIDMQARIEAAVSARRSDDFVIIVRSDEFYVEGGGGSGSVDEAVARGIAYEQAGADVYLPTFAPPEAIAAIGAALSIPVSAYGGLQPGIQFSLATGWGTASAARAHLTYAKVLLETGAMPDEAMVFPDKDIIIGQGSYDDVITRWANRTGRPLR